MEANEQVDAAGEQDQPIRGELIALPPVNETVLTRSAQTHCANTFADRRAVQDV